MHAVGSGLIPPLAAKAHPRMERPSHGRCAAPVSSPLSTPNRFAVYEELFPILPRGSLCVGCPPAARADDSRRRGLRSSSPAECGPGCPACCKAPMWYHPRLIEASRFPLPRQECILLARQGLVPVTHPGGASSL